MRAPQRDGSHKLAHARCTLLAGTAFVTFWRIERFARSASAAQRSGTKVYEPCVVTRVRPALRSTRCMVERTGITSRPSSASWSTRVVRQRPRRRRHEDPVPAAVDRPPERTGRRRLDRGPTAGRSASRFVAPHAASSGSSSSPSTTPSGPTSRASSAVVQPDPEPTSRTRAPTGTCEQPEHRRDGARLRARLPVPQRQRPVLVRAVALLRGQEPLAGELAHRVGHVGGARRVRALRMRRAYDRRTCPGRCGGRVRRRGRRVRVRRVRGRAAARREGLPGPGARGGSPVHRRRPCRGRRGTSAGSSGPRAWAGSASSASTCCPTSWCWPARASAAGR